MSKPGQTISRESNALRASVLDAALELGIGTNPLVADWMFNNALKEEDEEEQDQVSSPSLTYGSSATSEESAFSVQTPSSTHSSSPALGGGGAGVATKFGQLRSDGIIQILDSNGIGSRKNDGVFSANGNVNGGVAKGPNTVSFPDTPPQEVPIPPRPTTPRKLKKKNKGGDGYESDGGYVSEGAGKKKLKEKEKKKDKGREKELEAGQEDERKRKKSLLSAVKSSKGKSDSKEKDKDLDASRGYETDGGASKSKSKPKKSKSKGKSPSADVVGVGYDTDAGYQSSSSVKKSKTRFFKLGGSKDKDSSASGPNVAAMQAPPVPALPADILRDAVSLPIAERFATTFGSPTSATAESATSLSASLGDRIDSPSSAAPSPPLPPSSSSGTNLSSPLGVGAHVAPRPGMLASRFAASTADRSSQASTESSNSSLGSSRRRGPFSPTPSSSAHGHGVNDSGASYSTLTSSQSHPQLRQQQILSSSRPTSPTGSAMSPSASISISISQVQDTLAVTSSNQKGSHPPVSFPLSRMPSPTPVPSPSNINSSSSPISPVSPSAVPLPVTPVPISPLQINKDHKEKEKGKGGLRLKPSLEKLGLPSFGFGSGSSSRGASPAPVSPVSPGAVGAALHSVTSSSRYGARPLAQTTPSTLSPRALISSPNTASNSPSPPAVGASKLQEQQQQKPAQLSLAPPSDGTSLTSRSPSPSRPNVLAYYDMPPPSPPPMGPLPTLPGSTPKASSSTSDSTPFPSASVLRQRMIDRSPRPVPADAVPYQQVTALQNIQRGRESPFPARPVLPPGTVPRRYGPPMTRQQQEEAVSNSRDVKRARFASGEPTQIDTNSRWMDDDESEAYYSYAEDEEGGEVIGYEQEEVEDEEDSQELRNVLDRFADDRRRSAEDAIQALERSHSFEALKNLTGQNAPATHHVTQPPPQPMYAFARPPRPEVEVDAVDQDEGYDGMTIGNRSSRWSGSIYSRNSILDEDESGQGRERLVQKVEEMLREGEKERKGGFSGDGGVIPPVPKLPAAYANMNNSLNGGATGVRSSPPQDVEVTSPVGRSRNRF
ncbi:hypothetical protein CVT26_013251 [Gymnopilus dilepis]|uniref:Uncharacterized protein n=1 Tax=Gymnopilus dilepis TaxID=231916 RepID=A0A409VUI7_9AGAR|nr:hypothetical protein CVT26_013251 [Gymnopilus dilepis]